MAAVWSQEGFCPFFEENLFIEKLKKLSLHNWLLHPTYILIIFGLSENPTANCESFDFQRGSLAWAISGNHFDQLIANCINDCPTLLLQDLKPVVGRAGGMRKEM